MDVVNPSHMQAEDEGTQEKVVVMLCPLNFWLRVTSRGACDVHKSILLERKTTQSPPIFSEMLSSTHYFIIMLFYYNQNWRLRCF